MPKGRHSVGVQMTIIPGGCLFSCPRVCTRTHHTRLLHIFLHVWALLPARLFSSPRSTLIL